MTQPNIFQEIQSDLEQQKLEDLWRKFGPYLVGLALCIVLATATMTVWKNHTATRNQEVTQALLSLTGDKAGASASVDVLEQFAAENSGKTQATFALLRAASLALKEGHLDKALSLYSSVAQDAKANENFRALAEIFAIEAQMDTGNPAALLTKLDPYLQPKAAWHAKALEDAGYLYLKTGDKDKARQSFTDLAQDASAPRSMVERAQSMLNSLNN